MLLGPRKVRNAAQGVGHSAAGFHGLLVLPGGLLVPGPGVLEGLDLGGRAGAVLLGEEDVVVALELNGGSR